MALSMALFFLWTSWDARGRQERDQQAAQEKGGEEKGKGEEEKAPKDRGEERPEAEDPNTPTDDTDPPDGPVDPPDGPGEVEVRPADQPEVDEQKPGRSWVTLGSVDLDPKNPYRMLVTLTTKGGAVARVEMSSSRYRDLDRVWGYLGHLVLDESQVSKANRDKGCLVQVVGPGTPAAKAGIEPGNLITHFNGKAIKGLAGLQAALKKTKPKQKVKLTIAGQNKPKEVTLIRRPLEVIRPQDRMAFLLTMHQVGAQLKLPKPSEEKTVEVGKELKGFDLWTGDWHLGTPDNKLDPTKVDLQNVNRTEISFYRELPKQQLRITKTYRLAKVPKESLDDVSFRAYHLTLKITIENLHENARTIAYQLDGATGLPTEGPWYNKANKVARAGIIASAGMRDVVCGYDGPKLVSCATIAEKEVDQDEEVWMDDDENQMGYLGVDAKYFSAVFLPQKKDPDQVLFARCYPILVGQVDSDRTYMANTSCRMISKAASLAPDKPFSQEFTIFVGPKDTDLLDGYQFGKSQSLKELVYYGWYSFFARPMAWVLHIFHDYLVFNYGLAILMLTVLVRSGMFPLSRKQAAGAAKMQELQPEIKKLQEKYKDNLEARSKAQQELFRKHNYNPLSGCLVLFVQLPIFVALYRTLMVDVNLRQAPLISESVRWCSNLAAPDMLYDWSAWMPAWVSTGTGFFGFGPYFNILPIFTIVLFIVQQKMFMPPPTDDQSRMQAKVMKYMMVFMGFIFFKVASGLCIYFIASSLWGLAERKLIPKPKPKAAPPTTADRIKSRPTSKQSGGGNGSTGRKKGKSRGKR